VHNTNIMAHSINTTPLLQEVDSSDNENEDITETPDDSVVVRDSKSLFKSAEPRDKYYMAYIIFYLLGMVTLLPWNFFITADDYWLYKFRNVSNNVSSYAVTKRTPLQTSFTSYISVASAVPSLVFLILNTALTHRISLHKRVIGSLIVMLGLFVMTLVFVTTNTDSWQNGFFIVTITTVVLLNVCSAVLSGSIFGVVGRFCPIYITATLGGQALGGIFAALAEIASLSIGASSVHSAFVYFIIGNLTISISIACYVILTKTVFFKFHLYERTITQNEFENELLRPRIISHKIILKKIWTHGVSMFTVFAITLSVYPSVTVLVESEGKGQGHKWNDVFFVPTIAYLLFSVGDYLGRIFAGRIQKPKKGYVLLILSTARFVFIPLLMLCNAQPRSHWAVVFDRDYQYILILFMCALSNGYLANITAICAPRVVESHEKETASSMMTVFMGVGLALGSGISLYMVKLL
jgi:equilibrative nucleoside transporter 1/2/3